VPFKTKYPSQLLSIGADAKTVKGEKKGVITGVLYMAPHNIAGVGNMCVFSDKDCRFSCLYASGRAEFTPNVPEGRIRKTKLFVNDNAWFMKKLEREITNETKKAKAKGMKFVVRLNGTTDIPWENLGLMEKFPKTQFYDYTKSPLKMEAFVKGLLPKNYHVTFSRSGGNDARVDHVLAIGGNVAVVFDTKKGQTLPKTFKDYKVIDGDLSDLRFKDKKNVVVGLRLKGRIIRNNLKDQDRFVIRTSA
jgi:hypothetical protein